MKNQLTDQDTMTFGMYAGKRMLDVPAEYLHYLWTNGLNKETHKPIHGYIKNCMDDLKEENEDLIWE